MRYYLPIKSLNKDNNRNKALSLIIEIILLFCIWFIGEVSIIKDFNFGGLVVKRLLSRILFIIIIFKPVNENFKIFFGKYAPKEFNDKGNTVEGAGALIGNLERLLVAILMYYGQYGAIGLVFTAKSVTRFEKISKEPSFAEYYLIGSLYSMICVLILYGFIIH